MGLEKREAKWRAAMEEARRTGKSFIVRRYPEFKARFIECVVAGCGWTEILPDRDDWVDDIEIQQSLLLHVMKQHRSSEWT